MDSNLCWEHISSPFIKVLKTWHLMCVVGAITGFGVLLIVGKTIAQAMTSTQLVTDYENREGVTVRDIPK